MYDNLIRLNDFFKNHPENIEKARNSPFTFSKCVLQKLYYQFKFGLFGA